MKHALLNVVQAFALWLLKIIGSKQIHVPKYMDNYAVEIEALVRDEEPRPHPGYFKYRRVFTIMMTRHPALNQRDLSKAIQLCSDSVASGLGQVEGVRPSADSVGS